MQATAPVASPPLFRALLRRARLTLGLCLLCGWAPSYADMEAPGEATLPQPMREFLTQYCVDCHDGPSGEAHLDLSTLSRSPRLATEFRRWEKVAEVLANDRMPPEDLPQPTREARQRMRINIEQQLRQYTTNHAGDPGRVLLRRLTAAEYGYTILDLTGLDFPASEVLAEDAVGGEGFANIGDVQFMQDSTLERYLAAAKWTANRAVLGAGPLDFFADAGQTGLELSAIQRIQTLYRQYGFRTAAGEGGEPFGLDLYPRAFYALWRLHHRQSLATPQLTLPQVAQEEQLEPRFLQHLQTVLHQPAPSFPTSEIVERWHRLPAPPTANKDAVRQACGAIADTLRDWQRRLARAAGDDEEAAVLSRETLTLPETFTFRANLSWPSHATEGTLELDTQVLRSSAGATPILRWEGATIRFQFADKQRRESTPLVDQLITSGHESKADALTQGVGKKRLRYRLPSEATGASVQLAARVELTENHWALVRCTVRDGGEQGDTAADTGEVSAIIGNAQGRAREAWFQSVLEFATALPDCSQREPAPSDRDPIPSPFDNTYNTTERNAFHTFVKYHRDDDFLYQHLLSDAGRKALDQAWSDLLTSFDYHQVYLNYIARQANTETLLLEDVTSDRLTSLPPRLRRDTERICRSFEATSLLQERAQSQHLEDALAFAELAWRRDLTGPEQGQLRRFYAHLRTQEELAHRPAMRAVLVRILVAPAFLYRLETLPRAAAPESFTTELSPGELASRLSYFLTASPPDALLVKAAQTGKLQTDEELGAHVRRLLRGTKVSRFVAEFFGQWFGVYRFDAYRGIDPERFPEFDHRLRHAMQAEAYRTWDYIVRENRPVNELLFANYSFLNRTLATHYDLPGVIQDSLGEELTRVANLSQYHRGGLLHFGAIHALTSAPLRTSAVKRGDWILRRVLGTPVPPPPADAGSIPAEETSPSGLTVRAQLLAHRARPECIQCHQRMDPLGFALENFNPIGRFRSHYRDGQPVDASGELASGERLNGSQDLLHFLQQHQASFHRTLSVKLLGFALGRSELLSDRPLIQSLQAQAGKGQGLQDLVLTIVTSPQFRTRRLSRLANTRP